MNIFADLSTVSENVVGLRHVQVFFLFFAMMLSYMFRVNMSMAIVAMTDSSDENSFDWAHQNAGRHPLLLHVGLHRDAVSWRRAGEQIWSQVACHHEQHRQLCNVHRYSDRG
ncbi:hypothetical protein ACJJTC_008708 [Scirpophaga incertulas]